MLLSELKRALTAVLVLAAPVMGAALPTCAAPSRSQAAEQGDRATAEKSAFALSPAEFQELKPILDLMNQPWTTIPWKYSITEARKQAAAAKKPIFMVVNTGNALGCT
jgi:hypothetical protein